MLTWPFDPTVPHHCWTSISAAGFAELVPGCVYTGSRLDGGVPLGGLGTGYFTLEGTGKLGLASIYNDIVPRAAGMQSGSPSAWARSPCLSLLPPFTIGATTPWQTWLPNSPAAR